MTPGPLVLADAASNAGPIGLFVVLLIGVSTVLLIRNMDKRVKRLPREFPDAPGTTPPGGSPDDR